MKDKTSRILGAHGAMKPSRALRLVNSGAPPESPTWRARARASLARWLRELRQR